MNEHCPDELLSAYLSHETSSDVAAEIEAHLRGCSCCGQILSELQADRTLLAGVPGKTLPETAITVLEAMADEKLRVSSWMDWVSLPRVWVPAAAMSLGLVAILLWLRPVRQEQDEIPAEVILAAHHRYVEEGTVPSSDLSASAFSAKLTSYGTESE